MRLALRSERGAHRPILVCGMPRSGTTWLGRLLATAPGTALVGREPMNPHDGQYRLGGTLTAWASLDSLSAKQRRAARLAFRGVSPFIFGRYGRRQWAAPLPWTRVVVKDPFAMLSLPALIEATGAVVVLLYRHPGAALASYRRMGWQPDLDELRPLLRAHRHDRGGADGPDELPVQQPGSQVTAEAMGKFWAGLYEIAMDQSGASDDVVVISHEELAGGGRAAARQLFEWLGLRFGPHTEDALRGADGGAAGPQAPIADRLHNLDRSPASVAQQWRAALDPDEIATVERVSAKTLHRMEQARLRLV